MMRKHLTYLFIALAMMSGCNKYAGVESTPEDAYISFELDVESQTKSLINPDSQTLNFHTAGSEITMYDVYTPTDKDVNVQDLSNLVQYLDEQNLKCIGTDWIFTKRQSNEEEVKIPWTKTGLHDFFAHNSCDASSGQEIPYAVGYSSFEDDAANTTGQHQYFRIPASGDITLTTSDNQFDFLYSSQHREVAVDGFQPVEMSFKHLFAAVYFEVKNISNQQMRLNSFSLGGIKDKGNAEVAYNGNVSLNLSATQANSQFAKNPSLQLNAGATHVLYDDSGIGQAFLIWPHSTTDFANASFTIKYNLGKKGSNWNSETTKTVKLSGADSPYKVNNWAAGTVYKYYITISDDMISLSVIRVVDWINDDVILEE